MSYSVRLSIVFALTLAGCSGKASLGPPRRATEGHVTYDSKPVPYGLIRFIPESAGPLASAIVEDGKYSISAERGVPIGSVRVEISALAKDPTGAGLMDATPAKVDEIPTKYNADSSLKEQIPEGSGVYTLNFDLKK